MMSTLIRLTCAAIVFASGAIGLTLSCAASSGSGKEPSHGFLENPAALGETVEYFWEKPPGEGPFPALLFLHGYQQRGPGRIGARAFVNWGVLEEYARKGIIAIAVSQPGFGQSTGDPDFCGPRTQAAVKAVIDRFQQMKFVDSDRVGIEGISRGAVVAAMVATQQRLSALVLISGVYSFDRLSGNPRWPLATDFRQETHQSISASIDRSAIDHVKEIRTPTLILAGANDPYAPVEQAKQFATALRLLNVPVRLTIFPEAGHNIPLAAREPLVNAFLRKYLDF